MSTQSAAMLAQFNQRSPYRRKVIDSQSDRAFGTWSYANEYDALYQRFSQNRNFNMDMWHQSIQRGEQDQYLAFLEQNKDTELSAQFYDPQYYDYENMMLELYIPFADNVNKVSRFEDVYDPVSESWVQNNIGDMTEQEYLRYQLDKNYEYRAAEITQQMEQDRKDKMGWLEKTGHSALATGAELAEGFLGGAAGALDAILAVGTLGFVPYATAGFEGDYLDAFVDYFGQNGLTALEKRTLRVALDEYERTHTYFKNIDGSITGAGKFIAGVANSMGMMIPGIVVTAATAGTALPAWLGMATFYASIFSTNLHENANNPYVKDSPAGLRILNTAVKTGVEAIIEWGLGKVLGGTIQNQMLGLKQSGPYAKAFMNMSKTAGLKMVAKSAAQEGLEEFLQDFSTNLVDQFMGLWEEGYAKTGVTIQTLCDSFWAGVLSSVFMTGGYIGINSARSASINATAKKYAQMEAAGELSDKDKAKINAFKKKYGTYDLETDIGPADTLIEEDGQVKKLRGLNKMYYGQILSDMRQAMNDLREGKVVGADAVELAQDVYAGLSVMTQFYSSFDAERIKNMEMLLNRVVAAEQSREYELGQRSLKTRIGDTVRKIFTGKSTEDATIESKGFATIAELAFTEMVGEVNTRAKARIKAAAEKKSGELTEGGVTEVKSIVDGAGVRHKSEMAKTAEKELSPKAEKTLEELSKDYAWIFTTDGHIAVEDKDVLFVSEAWLENYTVSDIYKFLEQSRVIDAILTNKKLQPFIKELVDFYEVFTGKGRAMVSPTQALMNFLFNENAYQAFLLADDGKAAHKHTEVVFTLHNTIKDLVVESDYLNWKGKPSTKRYNLLKQLYTQIKDTWRRPVLKAVLIWNFDPSSIGADTILTEADLEFIDKRKAHERALAAGSGGINAGAFEHLREDILRDMHSVIHPTVQEFLNRVEAGDNVTEYDRLTERIILDMLDDEYAFDAGVAASRFLEINLEFFMSNFVQPYENDELAAEDMHAAFNSFANAWFRVVRIDPTRVSVIGEFMYALQVEADTGSRIDYLSMVSKLRDLIFEHISQTSTAVTPSPANAAVTIPVNLASAIKGDRAETQFIADKFNEFQSLYGLTVEQMISGDLSRLNRAQLQFISQTMTALGITNENYTVFAIRAFEALLGDDYIVVPLAINRDEPPSGYQIYESVEQLYSIFEDLSNFVQTDVINAVGVDIHYAWERFGTMLIDAHNLWTNSNLDFADMPGYEFVEWAYKEPWALSLKDEAQIMKKFARQWPTIREQLRTFRDTLGITDEGLAASFDTGYYNVQVVRAIPAEELLSAELVHSDKTVREKALYTVLTSRQSSNLPFDAINDRCAYLRDIVSPTFLEKLPAYKQDAFSSIPVYYTSDQDVLGAYDAGLHAIKIQLDLSNPIPTLVHEINHALQHLYDLPNGANDQMFYDIFGGPGIMYNKSLLRYVMEHHLPAIIQHLALVGYSHLASVLNAIEQGKSLEDIPRTHDRFFYQATAYVTYMLISGELWARTYMHNGKPLRGYFIVERNIDGDIKNVVLTPDGREFAMRESVVTSFNDRTYTDVKYTSSKMTPMLVDASIVAAIDELFEIHADLSNKGYDEKGRVRDTYHTTFRAGKYDSKTVIESLLRPNVSAFLRMGLNIHQLITGDLVYLFNEDILARLDGNYSEGNIYWRLREYIEETLPGVSIDRRKSDNTYVLVNDNAFEDLYSVETKKIVKSSSTVLWDKYGDKGLIPLTTIYTNEGLNDLGIDKRARIYITTDPSITTRADVNSEYPGGILYINVKKGTPDSVIVQRINHEFRHLLQLLNNLELGFTTAFSVSSEMIAEFREHLPELFHSKEVKRRAQNRAKARGTTWEEEAVRLFVYRMMNGELTANGISANILHLKPTYVRKEGGKVMLFLPWYNAETGEGRHEIHIISGVRAETDPAAPVPTETSTPKKSRKHTGVPKYEEPAVDPNDPTHKRSRRISKRRAKGTNLQYFVDAGVTHLDQTIQDFVIATTGHEADIPADLMHAIKTGRLNKQRFNNWFRKVNLSRVNDTLFDIMNDTIFHNSHIENMSQLQEIILRDPAFYWALARILRKDNMALAKYVEPNSVDYFMEFIRSMEGSDWYSRIIEEGEKFLENVHVVINGVDLRVNIEESEEMRNHARLLALKYFDGTLAGAYEFARRYRQLVASMYVEENRNVDSLDKTVASDDKDVTLGDVLDATQIVTDLFDDDIGNDITALYEYEVEKPSVMIETLGEAYYHYRVREYLKTIDDPKVRKTYGKYLLDPEQLTARIRELEEKVDKDEKDIRTLSGLKKVYAVYENIITDMAIFYDKLKALPLKDLHHRYAMYEFAETVMLRPESKKLSETLSKLGLVDELKINPDSNIFNLDVPYYVETLSESTVDEIAQGKLKSDVGSIQGRIKGKAKTLLKYILNGDIAFRELPPDVQELFVLKEIVDPDTGKKVKAYVINDESYYVGRGRVALPDKPGKTHKTDMRESTAAMRHDTTELIEMDSLLKKVNTEVRKRIKAREKGEVITTKMVDELKHKNRKKETAKSGKTLHAVEFKPTPSTPKPRKGTRARMSTEMPNSFKVEALQDMPDILKELLETSFNELAYTKVQFASRDKEGHLYDKEALAELGIDPEDFESLRTHEIANWNDFYEANRATLISLTREDVKAIVQYFLKGKPFTIEGPANKLRAYEVFILGYIYAAAVDNSHNWNFNQKEIALLGAAYEARASEAGSALNAVSQMLNVIHPTRKVRAGMFEDWESVTDDDKTKLINAIDELGKAKTIDERKAASEKVLGILTELENKEITSKTKGKMWSKEWFGTLYKDLKSWRYLSMLSSPLTWGKNIVGNISFLATNYAGEFIGQMIFGKKAYRKDQWDFSVQVTPEVKTFIDEYFLDNEIFEALYKGTRYEERLASYGNFESSRLVSMIVSAWERRYSNGQAFSNQKLNMLQNYLEYVMSDQAFIKHFTRKYLGKILTNEVAKGKVDLSKGLSDNALQAFAEALIVANEDFMHKRSSLAQMVDSMRNKNKVLYEILTLWQPFLNSSWNIFTECLKLSPLGLLDACVRMRRLEQSIAKAEERRAKGISGPDPRMTEYLIRRDIGKGVVGLVLFFVGMLLTAFHVVDVEEEDDRMQLRVGDVRIDISELIGSSSFLAGTAITHAVIEELPEDKNTFGARVENMLKYVYIETFNGFLVNQILERHRWSGNAYDDFLNETDSFCRSFVPQLFQVIASVATNKKRTFSRNLEGQFERWLYSFAPIKGLGEYVINPYTGEQQTKYAKPGLISNLLAKGAIGGVKIYWSDVSEGERLCGEYGVSRSELTGEITVNDKKHFLDKEVLNVKYGELNKAALAKIKSQKHSVEMPNDTYKTLPWDQLSDKQKHNVLNRTMTKNAEYAKIYAWTQSGHKVYVSESIWKALRELGITQNVYKGDRGFVE